MYMHNLKISIVVYYYRISIKEKAQKHSLQKIL